MPLLPLQADLVYGPVRSRRLGWSLGVNVFPPGRKICNFNCAYCQYGWTREGEHAVAPRDWPAPERIADAVRGALRSAVAGGKSIDRITLAGSGEPTLHPSFADIVERLRAVRDAELPAARIAVLSNSGTIARPGIADALARVEDAYLKLDTADSGLFARLNGAKSGLPLILEGLRRLPHAIIQSLFTRDASGRIDNTTHDAVERWIGALKVIGPAGVHVYTIDRAPAWSSLQRIAPEELEAIAAQARAAGLAATVY